MTLSQTWSNAIGGGSEADDAPAMLKMFAYYKLKLYERTLTSAGPLRRRALGRVCKLEPSLTLELSRLRVLS